MTDTSQKVLAIMIFIAIYTNVIKYFSYNKSERRNINC